MISKDGKVEKKAPAIPLKNYMNGNVLYDTLYSKADRDMGCTTKKCQGSMMTQWKVQNTASKYFSIENFNLAESFLREFYTDEKKGRGFLERWETVLGELTTTGTYVLTTEELDYAAKLAWRNHTRCVARIQWKNLMLFDHTKDVHNTDQMFAAMCEFIKYATNDGVIKPALAVFRPRVDGQHDLRVWNQFSLGFAGYQIEEEVPNKDGTGTMKVIKKVGDQGNVEFTQFCQRLGWKGKGTDWDILPFVLSDDGTPKFYEVPEELVLRVHITHPTLKAIDSLNLQWYAVPSVAGMMLEGGGLQFPAAPFGGWYLSLEVVRDIIEPRRYNLLEKIGALLELDMSNNTTLWKDRVALEVNQALIYSFNKAGVSIVDQHSVSEQFQTHMDEEYRTRGGCPSDWLWITPSQSASLTPLFHQEMLHYHLSPSFETQELLWKTYRFPEDGEKRVFTLRQVCIAIKWALALYRKKALKMPQLKIFYGTETGTSKRYAEKLSQKFGKTFNVHLLPMPTDDFEENLKGLSLFVTSTFGNGDAPKMAEKFSAWLDEQINQQDFITSEKMGVSMAPDGNLSNSSKEDPSHSLSISTPLADLKNLSFGVFALGSTAYPKYCGFGTKIDSALQRLNATRLVKIGMGDELGDRDGEFQNWSKSAYEKACLEVGLKDQMEVQAPVKEKATRWRVIRKASDTRGMNDIVAGLGTQFGQKTLSAVVTGKTYLTPPDVGTALLNLDVKYDGTEPLYVPGDHLAVFPVNSDEDIDFLMQRMVGLPEDSANALVELQEYRDGRGWFPESSNYPISTVRDLFKYHISIKSTPTINCMDYLSRRAGKEEEKNQLEVLNKNYNAFNKWRQGWPGIIDVFRQFPSIKVDAAEFAARLPALQPRFYSIASSLDYLTKKDKKSGTPLDLVFNVVRFQGPDGSERKGFCSDFLYNLEIGSTLACFRRTAKEFHLPKKNLKDIPIILVGAGTGIAPFRGFWQQRLLETEQDKNTMGVSLFYGCWDEKSELFNDETSKLGQNIIKRATAFSRKANVPKEYVQELVKKNGRDIFHNLVLRRGSLYVCGGIGMADAVDKTIIEIVGEYGKLDKTRAEAFVKKIKSEGRFCQDIFGQ